MSLDGSLAGLDTLFSGLPTLSFRDMRSRGPVLHRGDRPDSCPLNLEEFSDQSFVFGKLPLPTPRSG